MSSIALKVEQLGKAYQLGQIGTGTLSRDLARWYANFRGSEDPFLKVGEINDRTKKGECDMIWSLKDINFEIKQGQAVGIIGNNGAGKSTLLKILSKVTAPTTGKVYGNGRIASLLEVGTGFHPELSGRENIFLNGAILGMRKKEIAKKFDEIVDFAGVERYIDTPVKRYSSGMYVRLAFAVAAHLESEILIVDEVLAVGDAEFQKKCLGKMSSVSQGDGRTVLFVSHNMNSIQKLCDNCILLENGLLMAKGNTNQVISIYQNSQHDLLHATKELDRNYSISNINFSPEPIHTLSNCELTFEINSKEERKIESIVPLIFDIFNQRVAILDLRNEIGVNHKISSNKNIKINISIKNIPLLEGEYSLGMHINDEYIAEDFSNLHRFNIWPKQNNTNEIMYEYETVHRGYMNFDFEVNNKAE